MVHSAHSLGTGGDTPDIDPGRLAAVLGALSLATDLGVGNPAESSLRTAVLAARLAGALGLADLARRDVYYTALLRYLGCTGFAHEEAAMNDGDDLAYLTTFQKADPARLAETIALALRGLAKGKPLGARARAVKRFLSDPKGYAKLAQAHCDQAMALAEKLDVGPAVVVALGEMYERFDGRGAPRGLRGAQISTAARILALAQAVEVHGRLGGLGAVLEMTRERRATQFDPTIADVFLANAAELFEVLMAPSIWEAFLDAEPAPHRGLNVARLDDVALAFARYVDLKSPFTLGHSTGVARLAAAAASEAGLGPAEAKRLERAALLHDLGRVSVPNGIWDKPGPLDDAERERVRLHAYHGERILRQAPALAPLASIAGAHHERIDGSGYHRGVGGAALDPAARLLAACDAYQAMTEARPWRAALAPEAAAGAMAEMVTGGVLDHKAVAAVLGAAGHLATRVRKAWPAGLSDREVEILILVARGLSNKEIGRALFISPITAKNHVAHIYEKTGLATRSAAALFAVTQGIVDA